MISKYNKKLSISNFKRNFLQVKIIMYKVIPILKMKIILKKKKKSKTWEEFFLTSVKEKNKLFVPKIENNIPEEIGEEIVNGWYSRI